MNKTSIISCRYCHRGCEISCFDSHRSKYYCHDTRCRGHEPQSSGSAGGTRPSLLRSSSKRHSENRSSSRSRTDTVHHERRSETRLTAGPPSDGLIYGKDKHTGERFSYPRNPNHDRDHVYLCARHPAPKPGFRYGYDRDGSVLTFKVRPPADDYCDAADARRPSRSASHREGGDSLAKRRYSTHEPRRRDADEREASSGSYSTREPRREDDRGGLSRSYSTRETYREEGGVSRRRPSVGQRYHTSRAEQAGGFGGSYDSARSRYPPDSFSRSQGERRERGGGGGGTHLRPEAAYEAARQRVVKPEDVGWEIEEVIE